MKKKHGAIKDPTMISKVLCPTALSAVRGVGLRVDSLHTSPSKTDLYTRHTSSVKLGTHVAALQTRNGGGRWSMNRLVRRIVA